MSAFRKPLRLDDITLVALDCVAHPLTRLALEDSLKQIQPKEVIVWTDRKIAVPKDARMIETDLRSLDAVAEKLWLEVYKEIKTSHVLVVQWDGWVIDAAEWDTRWLDYDYIGAPWTWYEKLRVGNGGFSLRSTDLMRFLASHQDKFMAYSPEDVALCRQYRTTLEAYAFNWASEAHAQKFSFERAPPQKTFGFHGSFNWPHVLDRTALYNRVSLASGIPYIQAKPDFKPVQMLVATAGVAGA